MAKRATHGFGWLPTDEILASLGDLKLIHGVAMTEGALKGSEQTANQTVMPRDSVISGAGALRAVAISGAAVLDIDHFESELPAEYTEKYGKEIADPYPPGIVIDAQAVENTIPDGAGGERQAMQVEFIALIENPKVYDLVKNGHVVGCSVTDMHRGLDCSSCGEAAARHKDRGQARREHCACVYGGSAYVRNSLMLDLVPNSHSTWVAPLDAAGIERIKAEAAGAAKMATKTGRHARKRWAALNAAIAARRKHAEGAYAPADLSLYMGEDGYWLNGVESAEVFLEKEKGLPAEQATAVAAYLVENPSRLSRVQLQDLSGPDIAAWWGAASAAGQAHAAPHDAEARVRNLERRVAKLTWLGRAVGTDAGLLGGTARQAAPLGLGEVNYGAREPSVSCATCRWFSGFGKPNEVGVDEGHCVMTDSDVKDNNGCDRFENFPGSAPDEQPDITELDPDGEAGGDEPAAPTGDEEEPQMEDRVEPEDGKCPEGYTLSEDGAVCVRDDMGADEMGADKTAQPGPAPQSRLAKPMTVPAAARAEILSAQAEELNRQIATMERRADALRASLRNAPRIRGRHHRPREAELDQIRAELVRLHGLKKKSAVS